MLTSRKVAPAFSTRPGTLPDCISVEPSWGRSDLGAYLSRRVRKKWWDKFGARRTSTPPTAIAVALLKGQEHVLPWLLHDRTTGVSLRPPGSIWADCPGLQAAWFGLPPWYDRPHRP